VKFVGVNSSERIAAQCALRVRVKSKGIHFGVGREESGAEAQGQVKKLVQEVSPAGLVVLPPSRHKAHESTFHFHGSFQLKQVSVLTIKLLGDW
jgi:hypothetical protein